MASKVYVATEKNGSYVCDSGIAEEVRLYSEVDESRRPDMRTCIHENADERTKAENSPK